MRLKTVEDLEVGDVGFSTISGRTGGVIALGQGLIDVVNLLRGRTVEQSWFSHAFIVIDKGRDSGGPFATVLEAMPRGAVLRMLRGTDRMMRGYGWVRLPLASMQKVKLRLIAPGYVGIPYSFADYASIALLHLGLPRARLARSVTDSGHMICSQLVDHLLCLVGFHVFADDRLSQDVTPGALFHQAGALGEVVWW